MNSFKKIAIALAAALTMGTLVSVPAQATSILGSDTFTVSASTATARVGDTATVVLTTQFLAGAALGDTMTLTASMAAVPDGVAAFVPRVLVRLTGDTVNATMADNGGGVATLTNTAISLNTRGTFTLVLGLANGTSGFATVGTYVFRVTPVLTGVGGAPTITATFKDITVTVSAALTGNESAVAPTAAYSATNLRYVGAASGAAVLGVSDSSISFAKTTNLQAGYIAQLQGNVTGNGVTKVVFESVTATVSGPGTIGGGSSITQASAGRALTVKYDDYITIWSDGTSGVSTITITGATTGIVYGTKNVSFYGAVTKVEATLVGTAVIRGARTADYLGHITAVAKDANGIIDPTATAALKMTSNTTWAMTANQKAADSASVTTFADSANPGYKSVWNITNAQTTDTGNVTVLLTIGNGTDSATAVSIRISNGIGGITLTTDKTSYLPNSVGTLTITATDSSGAPAATDTYANLFTSALTAPSGGLSGTVGTASYALTNGVATISFTAGAYEITTILSGTPGTDGSAALQLTTVSVSIKIFDPVASANAAAIADAKAAAEAATDAANEATDAANEATAAALLAAEAADAATVAAEEARDAANEATAAVADLAIQVATFMAFLKAQITTLANTIAKIAKKLKV